MNAPLSAQLQLLRELTETVGVSGDEGAVRKIVSSRAETFADDLRTDAMGNLLVVRKSAGRRRLKLMLAAHMDEVGLMVVAIEKHGGLKFGTVGGIRATQLPGKPVWVGQDRVPGVIGMVPVHLASKDELKRTVAIESMTIDIGASSEEAAQRKVTVGDRVSFATPFLLTEPRIRAKALDDRLGVTILLQLLEEPVEGVELLGAFTVQEEIGLRGARIAAHSLDPDAAIALDCTPARDLPTWDGEENTEYNSKLGAGPAIYAADRSTLAHPGLLRHMIETAEREEIKYQIRQPGGGSTDAGVIHLAREGIPSISVSVPARYIHTAASVVKISDWNDTVALARAAVHDLTRSVLRR